jgi:hypothetical protein
MLQDKCGDLETLGVIRKPEDMGFTVDYLNPSFLVSKSNGGHGLHSKALAATQILNLLLYRISILIYAQ